MKTWFKNSYFLSFLLACCWGPSFMFIKFGLLSFSPTLMVQLRLSIAAALLLIYLSFKNINLPKFGIFWLHCSMMGLFASALPFTLFALGEEHIDSALAGILNGLTPIFTVILAKFLLKNEKLTPERVLGIACGFIGFCSLLLPTLLDQHFDMDSTAIFMVTLAALSYAVAMVYGKIYLPTTTTLAIPACQILCGSVLLFPFTLFFNTSNLMQIHIQWSAIMGVLGLAILGTVFAFIIYFKILEIGGAVVLSMASYLLPVFGIIFGVIFLHEKIKIFSFLGTGVIIVGMMLVNNALKLSSLKHRYSKDIGFCDTKKVE